MDLAALSDEQLDAHRRAVLAEQERRVKVAQLPDQLAAMTRDAVEAGCDPEAIRERVSHALTPEQLAQMKGE